MCFRSGPISIELRVYRRGYVPGDRIQLSADVENTSAYKLRHCRLVLTQVGTASDTCNVESPVKKVNVKEADLLKYLTLKALRYGSHSVTCKLHRTCLYLVSNAGECLLSIHQMVHPRLRLRASNCSLLHIYLPERIKG